MGRTKGKKKNIHPIKIDLKAQTFQTSEFSERSSKSQTLPICLFANRPRTKFSTKDSNYESILYRGSEDLNLK